MNQHTLIKDFDITKFEIGEITKNLIQMIAIPQYDKKPFVFQTDFIHLTTYGIPRFNCSYHQTDYQRQYMHLPLDPQQPSCTILEKKLNEIDDKICNNKENIFKPLESKKIIDSMSYGPCVKEKIDDDMDYNKNFKKIKKIKPKYCKLKINPNVVKLFVRDTEDSPPYYVKTNTITDIEQYVCFKSLIKLIVVMDKLWANKILNHHTKHRNYGVSLSIIAIDVIPYRVPSVRDYYVSYKFVNLDSTNNEIIYEMKNEEESGSEYEEEEEDEDSDE